MHFFSCVCARKRKFGRLDAWEGGREEAGVVDSERHAKQQQYLKTLLMDLSRGPGARAPCTRAGDAIPEQVMCYPSRACDRIMGLSSAHIELGNVFRLGSLSGSPETAGNKRAPL